MSPNVMMGLVVQLPGTRGAERRQDDAGSATGFEEALAGNAEKRRPPQATDAALPGDDDAPAPWMHDTAYGVRFTLPHAGGFGIDEVSGDGATIEPTIEADAQIEPDATDAVLPHDTEILAEPAVAAVVPLPAGQPAASAAPRAPGIREDAIDPDAAADSAEDADLPQARRDDPATARAVLHDAGPTTSVTQANAASGDRPAAAPHQPRTGMAPVAAAQPGAEVQAGADAAEEKPADTTPLRTTAPSTEPAMKTPPRAAAAPTPAADVLAGRVNVLGFSSAVAPAPAQPPLGMTAAGLVSAISGDGSWRQAASEAAQPTPRQAPLAVSSLRIQLNPAELGMVTARLTANGSQLSVEIQVETSDARQRLAADSEAILKALRAVGYDVEKVTIQQAPQGGQANAHANGGTSREPFQPREDANADGRGGREAQGGEKGANRHGDREAAAERSGGGLYI